MSKRTLRRAAERAARKAESIPVHTNTVSAVQLAANRENAQLSSGPVTPEGKAIVSQNRRTHGLTGHFHILPWENAEQFQALTQTLYAEHQPQTDNEKRLVDSLIQHYWLKERAVQLQEQLLLNAAAPTEVDGRKLSLFLRYQATHERSYCRAERELLNLKKEKLKQQIGFESQNAEPAADEAAVESPNAAVQFAETDDYFAETRQPPLSEAPALHSEPERVAA